MNVKEEFNKTSKKMKQILLKIGALSLFGIFCAFLISQSRITSKTLYPEDSFSKYALQSTGNLNQSLGGEVDFETIIDITTILRF